MNFLLQWFIGATALVALFPYLDRLRLMTWRTHRRAVVAMHLLMAMWLGSVAYDALIFGTASWYHLLAIGSAGSWLLVSWDTWRSGPPIHTTSGPGPLRLAKRSS